MAKFAVFFTFKGETIKGLMDKPSDRAAVVSGLCESAGGHMEAYYLMFGAWDGFVIADVPDSKAAGALSLAVSSSGGFGHIETHELIEPGELAGMLSTAAGLAYKAPGK
ncbi:MAG: GYD domain-containing protein [Pseudonocardiales bacterium]